MKIRKCGLAMSIAAVPANAVHRILLQLIVKNNIFQAPDIIEMSLIGRTSVAFLTGLFHFAAQAKPIGIRAKY